MATVEDLRGAGLEALAFARRVTGRLLEGIDGANAMTRCAEGGSHAMHIVGHLAVTDDTFLSALGGVERGVPEAWLGLFGRGAEPMDDASAYPAFDEARAALDERREALRSWLSSLDGTKLLEPLPEGLRGFASNHAVLMSTLAYHEGFHTGQISAIRRRLGLARVLG